MKAPRVLIVDDSARSRMALADALIARGCEVVGRAMDGQLGLKLALDLDPDVITCDLEMPRMDGFTFLRIITHQKAVPVIVVTTDARPESAIQALELGARDFVVKPGASPDDVAQLGEALASRIHALVGGRERQRELEVSPEVSHPAELELVVLGASTGGPRAVRDLLTVIDKPRAPILIAQHMPERFTDAFAGRLRRSTGHDVCEAVDGELLVPGMVRVGAGGHNLAVERTSAGGLRSRLEPPLAGNRHVPNVDRLLQSAAEVAGLRALGVVLTGMGRDGAAGAAALARAGAPLWTESASTAVIDGMPEAAREAHGRAVSLPLDELAAALARALAPR